MAGAEHDNLEIDQKGAKPKSTTSLGNVRKPKGEGLSKEDICDPVNFTHVQHVGWDPEKGFDVERMDKESKIFFKMAGVSDNDLNDSDTRNFIFNFISYHGGLELAKQEIFQKSGKPESASSHVKDREPKKREKKEKTREDINNPTNFTHGGLRGGGQHVGWLSKEGFNVERMNEDLKEFFKLSGVSDDDLKDADTTNFIFDFISNHAMIALERAKQEILQKSANLSIDDSKNLPRPKDRITQVPKENPMQVQPKKLMTRKMSLRKRETQNVSSNLLTQEENQKIFLALGEHCTTLSTTVGELYLTEAPSHSAWIKKFSGVICYVKDYERRSFFIKLFDMNSGCWVWEQELRNSFTYDSSCEYFHTFEVDNCMAGLNFTNNDEALSFKSAVQKKLLEREERKSERRRAQTIQPSNIGIVAARARSESTPSLVNDREPKKKETEKRKKKLTKEDISNLATPVQPVGWHPEKGFNVESVDEELKAFFSRAGVTDKDLNDNDTRNFLYDFIANHGGVERAKQEIVQRKESGSNSDEDNTNK